ncbi:hypothetical protein Salat_0031900 [Sesamum alatum]|uniref:Uncharacterized protein n=1 Tax=Sesamum alatum TaxID=300844 RepID=A0AAE1YUF8_9LAMI|nr:hypothetical protein Salat_0031900 [Sesamum alatum]
MRRNRGARKSRRIQGNGRKSGSPAAVPTRREGRRLTHELWRESEVNENSPVAPDLREVTFTKGRMGGVLCGAEIAILVKSPAEIRGRNSGSNSHLRVWNWRSTWKITIDQFKDQDFDGGRS